MPIRHPAGTPAFNIIRLSHIELGVTDLEASRQFYTEILGLIATEQVGDSLYLRCLEERNHHSFVLTRMEKPVVRRMGYKMASETDLDLLKAHFDQLGLENSWAQPYAQGRTLQARDPFGMPIEFYYKMEQVERKLQNYAYYQGCQPLRIDHFNCFAADVQAAHDFYALELGFRTAEYTETENPDNPQIWAVWMHRKGNVHDLALTNGTGPRLHHVAVYVPTAMQIIHLCDLMSTTGFLENMERGPGRHGISNAFFLYVRDPDGHRVEMFNSDYMTVDPDFEPIRWDLRDPQRQTLWGQPAPRSWFEEGSLFENTPVTESTVTAQPIIAPE